MHNLPYRCALFLSTKLGVPGWGAQDSEGFALDSWTSHAAIPISSKKETESKKKEIDGRKRWVTGMGSFVHSLKTLPSFKMRGMRISKKQCWLRVGTPQEPSRDGSEKHPQQSEKFLSTKRYCIIPTTHRQKHKFQLPTFIYNWTKSRRMKPVPSATQAALAAGRIKYSNYSGLPHMVTGAQASTCNQERERGQGKKVPWVWFASFYCCREGKSKTEETDFLPRTQKRHQNTLERGEHIFNIWKGRGRRVDERKKGDKKGGRDEKGDEKRKERDREKQQRKRWCHPKLH